MVQKKAKIKKKKEELPSFLLGLKNNIENTKISLKSEKSVQHVGPVFFGCNKNHPQPHSLNLGSFHHAQYTASSKENILAGLFLPKSVVEKPCELRKPFQPVVKPQQKVFTDLYPHKCPGMLKVFKPKATLPFIDFGQTISSIEAEASREIPICWVERESGTSIAKFELVTLSDVWEKERPLLPYKERIAHTHFPKEFVTLRMIGPPIPAAIRITKLPSKRKTDSEIDLHLETRRKILEKGGREEKGEEKIEVLEGTAEESVLASGEDVAMVEEMKFHDTRENELDNVAEAGDEEKADTEESLSEGIQDDTEKKEKNVIFDEKLEYDEEDFPEELEMESITEEEEGMKNATEEAVEE